MTPAAPAEFACGQCVQALIDLHNDGTFPDQPVDVLLAAAGSRGEVVQVGLAVEAGINVYMVEFAPGRVVGCLEHELAPA